MKLSTCVLPLGLHRPTPFPNIELVCAHLENLFVLALLCFLMSRPLAICVLTHSIDLCWINYPPFSSSTCNSYLQLCNSLLSYMHLPALPFGLASHVEASQGYACPLPVSWLIERDIREEDSAFCVFFLYLRRCSTGCGECAGAAYPNLYHRHSFS